MVKLTTGRRAPSRGALFMVVGLVLVLFGLASLESPGDSIRDLLRGQPLDRAWILVLAGFLGLGWGWLRARMEARGR